MRETRTRMKHHLHTGLHEFVHWLYDPAAWGRKAYLIRFPWLHVHLIPGWLVDRACDRYDRQLGLSEAEIRHVQPTSPAPPRTFSDGVAQLIDELDRRKEQP